MKYTAAIIFICLFVCGIAFGQEPAQTGNEDGSYSESKIYSPVIRPDFKKKKAKKSKPLERKGDAKSVDLTIPVSVYEETGAPVSDLKKEDFALFVDGVRIEKFEIQEDVGPLNIYLLIDTSPSVSYKIERLREFAEAFLKSLKPSDRFWMASFDKRLELKIVHLDTMEDKLKRIRRLKSGNGTSLYDSIVRLLESGFKDVEGNKAIVIVTDGVDTVSRNFDFDVSLLNVEANDIPFYPVYMDTEAQELANLRGRPTDLMVVRPPIPGMGTVPMKRTTPGMSPAEYSLGRIYLDSLVQITGGRAFEYDVVSASADALKQLVVAGIRPNYRIKLTIDKSVPLGRRLGIKLRVNRPGLVVTSRGSYLKN